MRRLYSSLLVIALAGVIGGIFAGPALSCMHDAAFRGLRDVKPSCFRDYAHAWKQNWRQSVLPGILFCLLLGFDIFMAMLFWWSASFPGWGTIALYLFSILIVTMWFSIMWPQVVLFEQPFCQSAKNCFLKFISYDGTFITEMVEPQMTAVVQPIEGLAKESVRLIRKMIDGRVYENRNVMLNVEIRKGKTTIV